jgi:peptide/nickel transport system permease protein
MAEKRIAQETILRNKIRSDKSTTMLGLMWEQLRRHKLAIVSIVVFIIMAVGCFGAPFFAPYKFDAIDLSNIRRPPSIGHIMGTDELGRDLFTRILYGGRVSILIGILSAFVGTSIGSVLGAVSGFFSGWVDNILMRVTDIAYSIPTLPLLIVLSSFTTTGVGSMVAIIGFLSWMQTARIVRAQVLSIREKDFVTAARMVGVPNFKTIFRHVLPNSMGPIIVGATLAVGGGIIIESSLSFLGLGVQRPTPTWGNMLMDSQTYMATQPWMTIFPGIAILLIVLAVNFIGDGLHDALDPTLRIYRGK